MPPFWPFKRSKQNDDLDEAPPAPVVYRKNQEVHTEKHSTSLERDEDAVSYTHLRANETRYDLV